MKEMKQDSTNKKVSEVLPLHEIHIRKKYEDLIFSCLTRQLRLEGTEVIIPPYPAPYIWSIMRNPGNNVLKQIQSN